jgi:Protein of unknown function (DUF3037)
VPTPWPFSYAIVRIVPHVEREEFVNAGVIVFCDALDFLGACVELDETRLLTLAPDADVALARRHLDAIPRICAGGAEAGPIGQLPLRERWQWLVAPRSTMLQTSPAHTGLCDRPQGELERLIAHVVRARAALRG